MTVDYPDEIHLRDWVTVTVRVRNDGELRDLLKEICPQEVKSLDNILRAFQSYEGAKVNREY